jgi:hypothetical protein
VLPLPKVGALLRQQPFLDRLRHLDVLTPLYLKVPSTASLHLNLAGIYVVFQKASPYP